MKTLKRILMLILALSVVFAFVSCGDKTPEECTAHSDADENGICDVCKKEIKKEPSSEGIELIKDEEILFQIVYGNDLGTGMMIIDSFVSTLEEYGVEISAVNDSKANPEADIEVLVGTVTSRGKEYEYYKYDLGAEGYAITAIDETKIVITGGSETAIADAFEIFAKDYLGIDEDMDELSDFTFTEEHDVTEVQDNYRITSITINGNDLKGYQIVKDTFGAEYTASIDNLQYFLYTRAGYYLPVVSPGNAGDKTISFLHVDKDKAGKNGFRVRVDGDSLLIECAYDNLFTKAYDEYYNQTFTGKTGDIELTDFTSKTIDISTIKYSDYGVVGDGKTDDTDAIRMVHNIANKGGQTVLGEKGKKYYINATYNNPIQVLTNVDWKGAEFIFDARNFTNAHSGYIFEISQDTDKANTYIGAQDPRIIALNAPAENGDPVIRGIDHGDNQTIKLDLELGFPAMLTVINANSRNYIRWGYVDSKGGEQKEVIIVDAEGNIDPSTPFLVDYEVVTAIRVHQIEVESVTIENATVRSLASLINLNGGYHSYNQGILISRPNTVVKNLYHIIEGEILDGRPVKVDPATGWSYDVTDEGFKIEGGIVYKDNIKYSGNDVTPFTGPSFGGFIQVSNTHNAHIIGCTFQARVHYVEGTYDMGANTANKIVFEDCDQSNFFDTREQYTKYNNGESTFPNLSICWGVMGSNYCKNMDYINCVLTRYDAHAGVFNGKVIGGKLAVLRLIGGGTFTIEGVEVYRNYRTTAPFQLREDYGATFYGTIIIKDVVIKDGQYSADGKYGAFAALFDAPSAPWNNGYVTHFPNLILDNISVETTDTEIAIVGIGGQTYSLEKEHYPARSIIKDDVSNPDALFTIYYETKNPNLVEESPSLFPYLKGWKKVDKKPDKLKKGEYTVVDNGNETYTIIAAGVPNINPYQPPEFIEIKNMKNAKNPDGKKLTLTLYSCNFFANTEIRDEDGVLKRVKVPK